MRIAQLANFVGPASGGMKTAIDALARGYVGSGARRLLVVPGPRDERRTTPLGDVVQLRAPRVGGGYRLIVEPWRVVEPLEEFGPTSLEVNDKTTLMPIVRWARRRGVPSVLFSHERLDHMLSLRTGLDTSSKVSIGLLNRMLVRGFDALVVTSRFAEGEFHHLARSAACPVHRVPLGVDLETFTPHPRPLADGTLRLVHVGRLSREKSPHLAVATAVALHERGVPVRLDVYGTGPHLDELEAIAGVVSTGSTTERGSTSERGSTGDRVVSTGSTTERGSTGEVVRFHGHIASRTELARRISEADVALSVCPSETFGLAVLEALACGTPVVTADVGGARELVDAHSGAWAAPEPEALADAVLDLASRPEATRRRQARARAEQYPWSRTVEQMLALHADLSGAARRTA
ncbi:glycosyltransferase [Nocardioides rotundus]|uniref:glycosyltransferase n=1 Tax=Nocardioides rotundus TaxID=1774216 RepID=UPI001CBED852|nr:glycosyltransferase [Nocardioides rotundus]UAL30317.1 glycosyltransferase [Nocardioides rotundus]